MQRLCVQSMVTLTLVSDYLWIRLVR